MAVAIGGFFGEYFLDYSKLRDSRDWNTKNYTYAVVKNKGEMSEEAKNETAGATKDTALFVATNKVGYYDGFGNFIPDTDNPVYQIRDRNGNINNDYYVDQATGDVYFRPAQNGAAIQMPAGVLPAVTALAEQTPQFFGTTFHLDTPPNPEDFGIGAGNRSNLTISTTFESAQVEVNGVPVGVIGPGNNFDTTGLTTTPPTPNTQLWQFSNSFEGGADNFSPLQGGWDITTDPVLPLNHRYHNAVDFGNSINFTGAIGGGAVVNPPPGGLELNGTNVTLEAWVYPTSNVGEMQIVNKESSYEMAIQNGRLAMAVETTAPNTWFWTHQATGLPGNTGNPPIVPLNQWSHVVGEFDGSRMRLYVNGVLSQTVQTAPGFAGGGAITGNIVPSGQPLSIGRRPGGSEFTGQIDELRISNNIRYPGSTYTPPTLGFTNDANTRGLWHFNEVPGGGPAVGVVGGTAVLAGGATIVGTNKSPVRDPQVAPVGSRKSAFNTRPADNFIVSTEIMMESFSTNPSDWAGIQFRTTNMTDDYVNSGYMVYYRQNGGIDLYKAGVGVIATGASAPFVLNTDKRTLEVHANGNNIQVFANGAALPIINYTDTQSPYLDGYVSLRTLNHVVSYDNFNIQSYPTPIQLLAKALRQGENNIVIKGYDQTIATPGTVTVSGTIWGRTDKSTGLISNVNMSSANIPPNLQALNAGTNPFITNIMYRDSDIQGVGVDIPPSPPVANVVTALDPGLAFWSASTKSALGIAGKIDFKMREGGSIQKIRDQFSNINTVMQDLTSILGSFDDLFESHLSVIR